MGDRVVHLADVTGAPGVEAMLENAAKEIRGGMRASAGVLVIVYQDADETVDVRCAGGVRNVGELLGLLELAKLHVALEGPDG